MNNITAIYIRVSTINQNIELQEKDLIEYCKQRKFKVYKIYIDYASGSKEKRTSLNDLMDDARKKRFDIVLCWRFDRWSRSIKHLTLSLEEFQQLGIDFISYNENIDTSSPMGRAMFQIISALAQLERDIIRERVLSGINNAKAKGVVLGRPKKRNDNLIINLRKKGLSYRNIAKQLGVSLGSVQQALKVIN